MFEIRIFASTTVDWEELRQAADASRIRQQETFVFGDQTFHLYRDEKTNILYGGAYVLLTDPSQPMPPVFQEKKLKVSIIRLFATLPKDTTLKSGIYLPPAKSVEVQGVVKLLPEPNIYIAGVPLKEVVRLYKRVTERQPEPDSAD